ncbi:MAG: type VII secretion system-associated protein [Actinoplanes sp.]
MNDLGQQEEFMLLIDPEWQTDEEDEPPFEAVIGMWPVGPDGTPGRFRSNPEYVPRFADSPSDPVDALLHLATGGEAQAVQLQAVLRDATFDLAMNGDGRPLIVRSPDDVLCVIVATSAPHRQRVPCPDWQTVDLDELSALTAGDYDALFNPGGPAPVRLAADFLRTTVALDEAGLAAAILAGAAGTD